MDMREDFTLTSRDDRTEATLDRAELNRRIDAA